MAVTPWIQSRLILIVILVLALVFVLLQSMPFMSIPSQVLIWALSLIITIILSFASALSKGNTLIALRATVSYNLIYVSIVLFVFRYILCIIARFLQNIGIFLDALSTNISVTSCFLPACIGLAPLVLVKLANILARTLISFSDF